MIFHHEHFIRGKEDLYHLIKRKVKLDAPPKHELETNVQIKEQVECIRESEPNFAELMNKLLKFKEDIKKNQKNLKSVLDTISREVSMKKSRVIKPYITEIKECFKNIDQAGKRVDETLNKNCSLKEKKSIVSKRTPPKNMKFLSAPDMKGFEEECTTKKQKRFDDGILSLEEIGSFKSIGSYIN